MQNVLRPLFSAWLAFTLTFFALHVLPGDAIESRLRQANATPEIIAGQRHLFGLDQPLWKQYSNTLFDFCRGDFGVSLVTHEKVSAMISARMGATFGLAGAALVVAVLLGLLMGSLAALDGAALPFAIKRLSNLSGSGLIALALATPVYWTGTIAIYLATRPFSALNLPSGGTRGIASLVLPALVLGFAVSGGIGRMVESSLRDTFQQPFLMTARAKGLLPYQLYYHALRHSLPPILSLIALQAGFLLGGAVIVEIIFTRRGLGSLLHQAVLDQDYPVVQALVLLAGLGYALTRLIGNWLMHHADPRSRDLP